MTKKKVQGPDGLDGFFDGFGNALVKMLLGIASFAIFSELALNYLKSVFGLEKMENAMTLFSIVYFAVPAIIIGLIVLIKWSGQFDEFRGLKAFMHIFSPFRSIHLLPLFALLFVVVVGFNYIFMELCNFGWDLQWSVYFYHALFLLSVLLFILIWTIGLKNIPKSEDIHALGAKSLDDEDNEDIKAQLKQNWLGKRKDFLQFTALAVSLIILTVCHNWGIYQSDPYHLLATPKDSIRNSSGTGLDDRAFQMDTLKSLSNIRSACMNSALNGPAVFLPAAANKSDAVELLGLLTKLRAEVKSYPLLNTDVDRVDFLLQVEIDRAVADPVKIEVDTVNSLNRLTAVFDILEKRLQARIDLAELEAKHDLYLWLKAVQLRGIPMLSTLLLLLLCYWYVLQADARRKHNQASLGGIGEAVNEREIARLTAAYESNLEDEKHMKWCMYFVVLLMLPFFNTIDEDKIDLDKPFINFRIPAIDGAIHGRSKDTNQTAYKNIPQNREDRTPVDSLEIKSQIEQLRKELSDIDKNLEIRSKNIGELVNQNIIKVETINGIVRHVRDLDTLLVLNTNGIESRISASAGKTGIDRLIRNNIRKLPEEIK